jgi:hypothetical protein
MFVFMMLLAALSLFSLDFTIGTGTGTINYPFLTYWMDGRTQMLYYADEMLAAGAGPGFINSIGFNVSSYSSQVMHEFWVRMQHVTDVELTTSTDASDLQMCLNTDFAVPGTGWCTIPLTTPFFWDGVNNLLIDISYDNTSYSSYSYVRRTITPVNTARFYYNDNSNGHNFTNFNYSANRPNLAISLDMGPFNSVLVTSSPSGAQILDNGAGTGFTTPYTFHIPSGDVNKTYTVTLPDYDWAVDPLFDSNVITTLDGDRQINFIGTFHYIDAANGFEYLGDPGASITAVPTAIQDLAVPLPGGDLTGASAVVFTGTVNGSLTIAVPAGTWYILAYYNGAWNPGTPYPAIGPANVVFPAVPFGGKTDVPVIMMPSEPTLPVELSSFDAVLTAGLCVSLTWVTQSETQLMGYNIYRSEDASPQNAAKLNLSIIPAGNTSHTQSYSFTDVEVAVNATYNYWLESVELDGSSQLYGPVGITVVGDIAPGITEISSLGNIYPNPFRRGGAANFDVSVKTGETGTITIYNLIGQVVKTWPLAAGEHNLSWDGQGCASGLYFIRLNTPSTAAMKKIILLK